MYWIKEMQSAIGFIEGRLTEELSIEEIARSANSSTANFQRIFSIVTGMTVPAAVAGRKRFGRIQRKGDRYSIKIRF
jgi:AraC family transcriptional regulator